MKFQCEARFKFWIVLGEVIQNTVRFSGQAVGWVHNALPFRKDGKWIVTYLPEMLSWGCIVRDWVMRWRMSIGFIVLFGNVTRCLWKPCHNQHCFALYQFSVTKNAFFIHFHLWRNSARLVTKYFKRVKFYQTSHFMTSVVPVLCLGRLIILYFI
jgi:hypothetical protein